MNTGAFTSKEDLTLGLGGVDLEDKEDPVSERRWVGRGVLGVLGVMGVLGSSHSGHGIR